VRENSTSSSSSGSSSSDHTAALLAVGGQAAVGLWSQLAGRSWLVRLATSAEPPFARHTCSGGSCELADTTTAPPSASASVVGVAERCSLHSATATTTANATSAAAAVGCDAFSACLFEHMCRNALLRRLHMPHRFLALVQVELRDLKNLSPHFAASPMDVYAAVRLKRSSGIDPATSTHSAGSSSSSSGGGSTAAAASSKHTPLGTAITEVRRVVPSAEAGGGRHWGGAAVFRFPLPEAASSSIDALGAGAFAQALELYQQQQQQQQQQHSSSNSSILPPAGPPSVLQLIVHRKHLLADDCLGAAEVPLHNLSDDVQLDEWVPLKQVRGGAGWGGGGGHFWFLNVRVTLRFVVMCAVDPPLDEGLAAEREVLADFHNARHSISTLVLGDGDSAF
jgi:hypothetical protein